MRWKMSVPDLSLPWSCNRLQKIPDAEPQRTAALLRSDHVSRRYDIPVVLLTR